MTGFADQTIFEAGKGNCLAACVASVLGWPIDQIPNFAELDYFIGLYKWLEEQGLRKVEVRFSDPDHCRSAYFGYSEDLVIMWGASPRATPENKVQHAVVGKTDGYGLDLVHDPHPSRAGLNGEPHGVMWIFPKDQK